MNNYSYCLWCKGKFENEKEMLNHVSSCTQVSKVTTGTIDVDLIECTEFKPPKSRIFSDVDWSYVLSIIGIVVMNTILTLHINLSLWEGILESFSLGFVIPRLLK